MRITLIAIVGLAACAGSSRTAPQTPAPSDALAVADCLRLLGGRVGISGEAPYERAIEPEPDSVVPSTETAGAEVVTLRGRQPASICIVWRRLDTRCPEDASEECIEEEEHGRWSAEHVVAAVAGDRVTDAIELDSQHLELTTEGEVSWKVLAIGPDVDALLLAQRDDAGDGMAESTRWLVVAGGKLVELFSYRTGTDDLGRMSAEVEHEITSNVTAGHFDLRFRVRTLPEDADEDADLENLPFQEETCTWDPAESGYRCPKELVSGL